MSFPRSSYTGFPFNAESANDEFPFNRQGSRDANFQSTLDNLAQRHPKFAKHLTNIRKPFDDHSRFPFEDEDIDLDQYTKPFYNPQDFRNPEEFFPQTSSYQEQGKQQDNPKPQPSHVEPAEAARPDGTEHLKSPEKEVHSNLQQSSTTDLGQRQEPFDDRNQRSSSAPPGGDNKKRFTSSINIPINNNPPPEDMAQQNSNQHQDSKPVERIIPIQIEGRDGPIIPKNTHIPQQNQTQSSRSDHGFARPEPGFSRPEQGSFRPEPGFSRPEPGFSRPEQGSFRTDQGFSRPEQGSFRTDQGFSRPEQGFPRQNFQEQHSGRPNVHTPRDHHSREEIPIPVQKEIPKTQPQPQKNQEEEPKPEPKFEPPKRMTPIEQIQIIKQDVSKLMEEVEHFEAKTKDKKDKQYLYLDEMLTRNLLKLDNIDTQGQENIRATRKEAIRCIQEAISLLENKATGNKREEPQSDNEHKPGSSDKKAETNINFKKEGSLKMDTETSNEPSEKMDTTENDTANIEKANEATTEVNLETRAVLVSNPQNNPDSKNNENVASKLSLESSDSKDICKEKKDKKPEKKQTSV